MAEGSLDPESFRAGLAIGLRTAMVIVRDRRLFIHAFYYDEIMAAIYDWINRAEGKHEQQSAAVDGEAEYASWFPTPGEVEVASWLRPEGEP